MGELPPVWHPKFCYDSESEKPDVVLLIENVLFKAPRQHLEHHSPILKAMFSAHQGEHPISLEGESAEDFEALIGYFHRDIIPFDPTKKNWASILRISHKYKMSDLHSVALKKLLKHSFDGPWEKLVLCERFGMPLESAKDEVYKLCTREQSIGLQEGRDLGRDWFTAILWVRQEELRDNLGYFGTAIPQKIQDSKRSHNKKRKLSQQPPPKIEERKDDIMERLRLALNLHSHRLTFNWSGKSFSLEIAELDRVFDLKASIYSLTSVPPERQKILGLVKGKLPPEQATIKELGLADGKKFSLVGTAEGNEIKDPSNLDTDLADIDLTRDPSVALRYQNDQRNIRKVKEMSEKLSDLHIINPLRGGKRLLVLDIDYTILDTKPLTSGTLPPSECARPGLHQFLEAIYPFYDICIWSQTSWVWLETKLVELGMIGGHRSYQISFVLDKTTMFTVFSERDNKVWQHSVKPLQIIWNRFPQFHVGNTIHIDDLSRNFALNPTSGLKITAFKKAHTEEARRDRELYKLMKYLVHIAERNPDFTAVKFVDWQAVVNGLPPH